MCNNTLQRGRKAIDSSLAWSLVPSQRATLEAANENLCRLRSLKFN